MSLIAARVVDLAAALASALALTLAVEMVLAALLLRDERWRGLPAVALVNLATNPAVNLIAGAVMTARGVRSLADPVTAAVIALLELLVILAEGLVLARVCDLAAPRALAVSLAMNAASFAGGLIVLGWNA